MSEKVQYIATGRRKKSIARVRMFEGSGAITVNKRPFVEYFNRESHRLVIMQPMELVKLPTKYDIYAKVEGGGGSGQTHQREGVGGLDPNSTPSFSSSSLHAGVVQPPISSITNNCQLTRLR